MVRRHVSGGRRLDSKDDSYRKTGLWRERQVEARSTGGALDISIFEMNRAVGQQGQVTEGWAIE